MNNLALIIGLLSTIVLSLYCVDFHTEPILNRLNQQVVQEDCPKTAKTKSYVEVMAKPITPKQVEPKEETELDILAKKILDNLNKNKDEQWRQ